MAPPQNVEVENTVEFGVFAPQWRNHKQIPVKFGAEEEIIGPPSHAEIVPGGSREVGIRLAGTPKVQNLYYC